MYQLENGINNHLWIYMSQRWDQVPRRGKHPLLTCQTYACREPCLDQVSRDICSQN
jgi:hypothetical protein